MAGATLVGVTASTGSTCNVPAGVANGDLLVAFLSDGSGSNYSWSGTGWTLQVTTHASNVNLGVLTKLASSEPSSYTFGGGTVRASAIAAYRGVVSETPDASAVSFSATASTLTPTRLDDLEVHVLADQAAPSLTATSGFTNEINLTGGASITYLWMQDRLDYASTSATGSIVPGGSATNPVSVHLLWKTTNTASVSIADTLSSVTDVLGRVVRVGASDTASSVVDVLLRQIARKTADTAATVTDATRRRVSRSAADTITTVTDSVVGARRVNVSFSDAATTFSDSAARRISALRPIADTASLVGDAGGIGAVHITVHPVYSFQWQRCNADGTGCVNIPGASSYAYTPILADIGKALKCLVTASNSYGANTAPTTLSQVVVPAGTVRSADTAVLMTDTLAVQGGSSGGGLTVTVTGTTTVGQTLTATVGGGGTQTSIYWGAWMDGDQTYEVYYPGARPGGGSWTDAPWDLQTWTKFESNAGKTVSMCHFGQPQWWNRASFDATAHNNCWSRGAIPVVDYGDSADDLVAIANGDYDAQITAWANAYVAWGKPALVRPWWEMNNPVNSGGSSTSHWFGWQVPYYYTPTQYINAWRHVVTVCNAAGATNMTWFWCPNQVLDSYNAANLQACYPGDSYVDWTGFDAYNDSTPSKSFYNTFKATYDAVAAVAPNKPMCVGEFASRDTGLFSAGTKGTWIADGLGTQLPNAFPKIKAVLWFNWLITETVTKDWPIESSTSARQAFATGISGTYYKSKFTSTPSFGKVPIPS